MYESVKLNMYYLAYLYFIYMIQKYVNACIQVFGFRNALYYKMFKSLYILFFCGVGFVALFRNVSSMFLVSLLDVNDDYFSSDLILFFSSLLKIIFLQVSTLWLSTVVFHGFKGLHNLCM